MLKAILAGAFLMAPMTALAIAKPGVNSGAHCKPDRASSVRRADPERQSFANPEVSSLRCNPSAASSHRANPERNSNANPERRSNR